MERLTPETCNLESKTWLLWWGEGLGLQKITFLGEDYGAVNPQGTLPFGQPSVLLVSISLFI